MTKNYLNYRKRELPTRVETLFRKRQLEKAFCYIQGFLIEEINELPEKDLVYINNFTRLIGRRIEVINNEVKGRVVCA